LFCLTEISWEFLIAFVRPSESERLNLPVTADLARNLHHFVRISARGDEILHRLHCRLVPKLAAITQHIHDGPGGTRYAYRYAAKRHLIHSDPHHRLLPK
jgi:hypothetical protein